MTTAPLQLQALRVSVPDGDNERILLNNANLTIAPGETVVLTGSSGSGKSTLLALAGLLRRTDQGDVIVAGTPTSTLSERARTSVRRDHIGIIYQSANLLASLTAREQLEILGHIAGAPRKETKKRATELLTDVGLAHRLDALPEHLSGGERQRVGVARALMARPSILLADEPTASLDPELSVEISSLIAKATTENGLATLLVTHDDAPLRIADRHLHLDGGVLIERTNVAA